MSTGDKISCAGMIGIVLFIVFMFAWIVVDSINESNVRSQCLECGYPDYIVHAGNGYCVRVGSVVVPVDEACPRRVRQGEEKP